MNINWVLANDLFLDPSINVENLKNTGSFWGSWSTWRAYSTDNVICYELKKAQELIRRNFQANCNFYIPNSIYASLGRPQGVKLFEGSFMNHAAEKEDEIVALNLASTVSDIVLLLGFDLSVKEPKLEKIEEVKAKNYLGLFAHTIKSHPTVQYILVDHSNNLIPELEILENISQDNLTNIIKILNS